MTRQTKLCELLLAGNRHARPDSLSGDFTQLQWRRSEFSQLSFQLMDLFTGLFSMQRRKEMLIDDREQVIDPVTVMGYSHDPQEIITHTEKVDRSSVEQETVVRVDRDGMQQMQNEEDFIDNRRAVVFQEDNVELRAIVDQWTRKYRKGRGVELRTLFEQLPKMSDVQITFVQLNTPVEQIE